MGSSTLSGRLEELGLDEILQIISLSRRTGLLTLKSRGREAVLQWRDGLLVRVSSTGFQQSLGELMVLRGVVDLGAIRTALSIQQNGGFREPIGLILRNHFQVELRVVEQLVREQMSNVLTTLFDWHTGDYDFVAGSAVETVDAAYLDPLQFLRERGGDPPPSSDEVARLRHLSSGEAAFAAVTAQVAPLLVLVDDDAAMLQAIAAACSAATWQVLSFVSAEDALTGISRLYQGNRRPVVLLDLIMPRMDGTGVLGGLELLQLLRQRFQDLPVLLMTDFHYDEAEQEATALGCSCLLKPRRGQIGSAAFASFITELQRELRNCLPADSVSEEG